MTTPNGNGAPASLAGASLHTQCGSCGAEHWRCQRCGAPIKDTPHVLAPPFASLDSRVEAYVCGACWWGIVRVVRAQLLEPWRSAPMPDWVEP